MEAISGDGRGGGMVEGADIAIEVDGYSPLGLAHFCLMEAGECRLQCATSALFNSSTNATHPLLLYTVLFNPSCSLLLLMIEDPYTSENIELIAKLQLGPSPLLEG